MADPAEPLPLCEAKVDQATGHVGYGHYTCDRRFGRVTLTERGMLLVLRKLGALLLLAAHAGASPWWEGFRSALLLLTALSVPRGVLGRVGLGFKEPLENFARVKHQDRAHVGIRQSACAGMLSCVRDTCVTVQPVACWAEEAGASFERAKTEGRAPEAADLWDEEGRKSWGSHIVNALKARALYQRNVHYLVREGEVVIIDTATGRVQPISRWTDGLHQARALRSLRPGLQLHLEHAARITGKLRAL